jgi:hypothetical protein
MDPVSHGLYGGVAFGRKSRREYIIAFFFGVMPDIFSFGPYFLLALLGTYSFAREPGGHPDPSLIPPFVHIAYDWTHSFIIYGIFFALLWSFGKRSFAKLTFGWPLHILVDIPTHSRAFFSTPFLWPASSFSVDGVPWSRPYIFIPNVLLLIALYGYWLYTRRQVRHKM